MEYLCLLREGFYVRWICAFHEKGFDIRSWCLLGETLALEVYTFHEKGFQYKFLVSLEKCRDGKDIDVLWDVIFVICMIYESMRDMEVKDSKNMGL